MRLVTRKEDIESILNHLRNIDVYTLDEKERAYVFFQLAEVQDRIMKAQRKSNAANRVQERQQYKRKIIRKKKNPQYYEQRLILVKELVFLCKEGGLKETTWSLWSYLSDSQKLEKWADEGAFLEDVLNPLQEEGYINLHNGRWEVIK